MENMNPKEAHSYLKKTPDAVFVDCRSEMEYMFVGHPLGAVMIPWYDGAEWELNPHFVGQVKKLAGANFTKRPSSSSAAAAIAASRRPRLSKARASSTWCTWCMDSKASSTRRTTAIHATAGASTGFPGSSTELG